MDITAIKEALYLMLIGMGGIFIVLGVIYGASVLLLKVFPENE